jgi:hypothetical protein
MGRIARLGFVALVSTLLGSGLAFAQTGSIAGVVKDASGAVLPGVSVEASSPALIENVRTVVTDGAGQYKIVDLRPGTSQNNTFGPSWQWPTQILQGRLIKFGALLEF